MNQKGACVPLPPNASPPSWVATAANAQASTLIGATQQSPTGGATQQSPSRNTVLYDVTIAVNEGWMTRDAARVVPELLRQAVAELKTKLLLVAAENAVTVSATITDYNSQKTFDLTGPEEDVR